MKIFFLFIAVLIILNSLAFTQKVAVLNDLGNPRQIFIFKNKIYIPDKFSIKVYNKKTGVFIKKFGKKGEGPGDFKFFPSVSIHNNQLMITTPGNRISFFNLNGDFIKIKKINGFETNLLSLSKNYIGRIRKFKKIRLNYDQDIGVFDEGFKFVKSIYNAPFPGSDIIVLRGNKKQDYKFVNDFIGYQVCNNKIFIGDTRKGFYIKVYDENGRFLYDINKKITLIKITDDQLEKFKIEWQNNSTFETAFKEKINLVFPEYIPAFKYFTVNNNRIYVQTYHTVKKKFKFHVLDLKGKEISIKYLPVYNNNNKPLYCFDYKNYVYLEENEDDEVWELKKLKIL